MLFPTADFAAFFVLAFAVNWLLRPHYPVWRLAIIGLSFWFYGYADARFVGLLAACCVVNWAFGELIHRALDAGERTPASRQLVQAAVVANLVGLGFFKYYDFFADSFGDALDSLGIGLSPPLADVLLPIGISFFTFHAISYVVDVGRGQLRPMGLLDFTLYMSFFPHLVAGPIVRASEFQPQLERPPDPRRLPAAEAFTLIARGLFKKVVVSSYLATELVDPVFGVPGDHGSLETLLAVYAYAVVIYADFSGYTDIAIGCALLLGIRFPQNFDAPYRALSLQDFWRRWHMTLSRWLRDYVYIPLGGNRDGESRAYRNLLLTMLLGGLWHGAAWTFVVWGALHGSYLVAERYGRAWWAARAGGVLLPPAASAAVRWLVTFHAVCLAWIFFRADSLGTAFDIIGGILSGGGPTTLVTTLAVATVIAALVAQVVPARVVDGARTRFTALNPVAQGITLAGVLTAVDVLGPDGVAPFIYFRF